MAPLGKVDVMAKAKSENAPVYVREVVATYRRVKLPETMPTRITCSREAARFLRSRIPDGPQERFLAVALDARNNVTAYQTVGVGSTTSCPVSTGDVLRFALLAGAVGLIVCHNHPSGDPSPSPEDLALTKQLLDACKLIGVPLMDHVILGDDRNFSFLDAAML